MTSRPVGPGRSGLPLGIDGSSALASPVIGDCWKASLTSSGSEFIGYQSHEEVGGDRSLQLNRSMEEIRMTSKILRVLSHCLWMFALSTPTLHSALLTQCDESSLRAAINQGGLIQFECDGVIPLSSIITVSKAVTLDANGHSVTLSGAKQTQVFMVGPDGDLTMRGITIADGFSSMNGGAIWVSSGILNLYQCRFMTNLAIGVKSGVLDGFNSFGGAIYSVKGKIAATRCRFSYNAAEGGASGGYGAGGVGLGGAIYSDGGWVTLTNCDFIWNRTLGGAGGPASGMFAPGPGGDAAGGSLYLKDAELTVIDSDFLGCTVHGGDGGPAQFSAGGGGTARGGVLAMVGESAVFIRGANLDGNYAMGGTGGRGSLGGEAQGGGIFCGAGRLVMRDTGLKGNEAFAGFGNPHQGRSTFGQGGAIFNNSTCSVTRCLFQSNKSTGGSASTRPSGPGGGKSEGGAIYSARELVVEQSALIGNTAIGGMGSIREGFGFPPNTAPGGDGFGGAISSSAGTVRLINSTLSGNIAVGGSAAEGGTAGLGNGGALFSEGDVSIRFCTIARNTADLGSVVSRGTLALANSIVAYAVKGQNLAGKLSDLGHNISSDSSLRLDGPGSRISTDPLLLALADNGGPTPTIALAAESPAIDAAEGLDAPLEDQRGVIRPAFDAPDIGSYERLPDAPQIASLAFESGQIILLSGSGPVQRVFSIEASTDLRIWKEIQGGRVPGTGRWSVEVPNTSTTTFYRAR